MATVNRRPRSHIYHLTKLTPKGDDEGTIVTLDGSPDPEMSISSKRDASSKPPEKSHKESDGKSDGESDGKKTREKKKKK
jgi:hypothetical protein